MGAHPASLHTRPSLPYSISPPRPRSPSREISAPSSTRGTPLPCSQSGGGGDVPSHLPSAHLCLQCCQSCLCLSLAVHSHGATGGLQANRRTSTGGRGSLLRMWVDTSAQDWSNKLSHLGVCTFMSHEHKSVYAALNQLAAAASLASASALLCTPMGPRPLALPGRLQSHRQTKVNCMLSSSNDEQVFKDTMFHAGHGADQGVPSNQPLLCPPPTPPTPTTKGPKPLNHH